MGDPLVRKLMTGPLLQQVVQAADLALSKPSEAHDFVLYSGAAFINIHKFRILHIYSDRPPHKWTTTENLILVSCAYLRCAVGHDTGPPMSILAALVIGDGLWSRFAALLAIELYEQAPTDSGAAIRIVYNGEVQQISGCSDSVGLCDWQAFRSIAMALVPSTAECGRALS